MTYANRVRRARRNGMCVICRGAITTTQQVGRLPAEGWAHTRCIVTRNRERTEGQQP